MISHATRNSIRVVLPSRTRAMLATSRVEKEPRRPQRFVLAISLEILRPVHRRQPAQQEDRHQEKRRKPCILISKLATRHRPMQPECSHGVPSSNLMATTSPTPHPATAAALPTPLAHRGHAKAAMPPARLKRSGRHPPRTLTCSFGFTAAGRHRLGPNGQAALDLRNLPKIALRDPCCLRIFAEGRLPEGKRQQRQHPQAALAPSD